MNDFFDSEMVRESLEDIKNLQDIITDGILESAFSAGLGYEDEDEEREQLDLVEELLEKQQLMYVRCKLSGDEDALMVADNMRESLRKMGMSRGTTVEQMFENMKGTIRKLKETLDN